MESDKQKQLRRAGQVVVDEFFSGFLTVAAMQALMNALHEMDRNEQGKQWTSRRYPDRQPPLAQCVQLPVSMLDTRDVFQSLWDSGFDLAQPISVSIERGSDVCTFYQPPIKGDPLPIPVNVKDLIVVH